MVQQFFDETAWKKCRVTEQNRVKRCPVHCLEIFEFVSFRLASIKKKKIILSRNNLIDSLYKDKS